MKQPLVSSARPADAEKQAQRVLTTRPRRPLRPRKRPPPAPNVVLEVNTAAVCATRRRPSRVPYYTGRLFKQLTECCLHFLILVDLFTPTLLYIHFFSFFLFFLLERLGLFRRTIFASLNNELVKSSMISIA